MYMLFIFQPVKTGTIFKSVRWRHLYHKEEAEEPLVLLLNSNEASLDVDNKF